MKGNPTTRSGATDRAQRYPGRHLPYPKPKVRARQREPRKLLKTQIPNVIQWEVRRKSRKNESIRLKLKVRTGAEPQDKPRPRARGTRRTRAPRTSAQKQMMTPNAVLAPQRDQLSDWRHKCQLRASSPSRNWQTIQPREGPKIRSKSAAIPEDGPEDPSVGAYDALSNRHSKVQPPGSIPCAASDSLTKAAPARRQPDAQKEQRRHWTGPAPKNRE